MSVDAAARKWASAWLTPPRLIMALFFVQAVALTNWFPRIPDVQAKLAIGPAELAVALMGMPVGAFLATTLVAARLIERFSARATIVVAFSAFSVALALPGGAWDVPSLFAALFLMGAAFSTSDIATNLVAARIQYESGRRIMNTCHGLWSTGAIVGSLIGAWFAEIGIDSAWHLAAVAVVTAPVAIVVTRALPPAPPTRRTRAPPLALPSRAMLGLTVFAFGAILAEVTLRNWGAVYLREAVGASAAATGVGYGAFSLMMAAGRLFGDRLADRFGPVAVGAVSAATAVAGYVVAAAATNVVVAVVGFAAIGLGASVGYPLSVTAVAGRGDRSPAINVASLSLIAFSSAFIGPPLVGFVAEGVGLRIGLAAIVPLLLVCAVFAGHLRPPAVGENALAHAAR